MRTVMQTPRSQREALLRAADALLVTRAPTAGAQPAPGQPGAASDYVPATPDVFIAVRADGRVQAFNGHVDLGTGVRTALAQIVAEELDVAFERVEMVLGHTEAAPNQGPTIASATIQITAVPLRKAAAQARAWLLARAADALRT
ncbi:molybdopterin cofactor-binding domain-containing protein, partial [Bordetella pertussis]